MEIILTKNCQSLTGSIGRGFGYHIKHRKNGFFVERNSNGDVPPDGHWKMICACANLADIRLHIADIKLNWQELYDALYEAYHFTAADGVGWGGRERQKTTYNANDILKLKKDFNL